MKIPHLIFVFTTLVFGLCAQTIVPCRCEDATTGKSTYGFCDPYFTKYILKCQYDSAYKFSNGLAKVIKDGKFGYIDGTGKQVVPALYDEGEDYSDGFAYVKKDGQYFYINKLGVNQFKKNFPLPSMPKIPNMSDGVKKMMEGYRAKMKNDFRFSDGMALMYDTVNKKVGFIDTKGVTVVPYQYIIATPFSEGVAFVKETPMGPTKAIGKNGIVLFELDNNSKPEPFRNGFSMLTIPDNKAMALRYNYVDKKGKQLLAEPVKKAETFMGNYAVVTNNASEMALIDRKGNKAFDQPLKYLSPSDIRGIYFYSNETQRGYGLIDSTGTRKSEAKYVNFTKLNGSVFLCKPWGSTVYQLLSTQQGELLYGSQFTEYNWITTGKNPALRLSGQDILANDILLDYEPATGKFLKDGLVLPTKDNRFLAVNYEKDKAEKDKKLKPGAIKYENEFFSLKFPTEMEIFKDTIDQTTYRKSTYFLAITKEDWGGNSDDYLNAWINRYNGKKYVNMEKQRVNFGDFQITYLEATTSDNGGKLLLAALDNTTTKAGPKVLYVIRSTYLARDDGYYKPDFVSTLGSLKNK